MNISQLLDKTNNNLDLIRIILASMVIIGHTQFLNGVTDYWIDPIGYFFSYTYSGALAVKLFFFISGLVVTNSFINNRDPVYFLISRFFRIMPALLFVLLLSVFVFGPVTSTLSLKDYFLNLDKLSYITDNLIFKTAYYLPGVFNNNLYPNAVNGSLWSLRYEVACYLSLFTAFLILGKKNKYFLNIPIFIVFLFSIYPNSMLFNYFGSNLEISLLPISFALGCFFAVNSEKIYIKYYMLIVSILLLYFFRNSIYNQLFLLLTFAFLVLLLSTNKFILKLKPKHDISYGIYLWGFLIQQILFFYLGTINSFAHLIIALLLTTIIGLISYIFIEKPFIKLGKKLYLVYQKNKFTA